MTNLIVYGRIAPKGSRITGHRANGSAFTRPASKYEKPWVEAVAREASHHPTLLPPYQVEVVFHFKRPAKPSYDWPVRVDGDKALRATLDGLVQGGLLADDKHVTEVHVRCEYGDEEFAEIVVKLPSSLPRAPLVPQVA